MSEGGKWIGVAIVLAVLTAVALAIECLRARMNGWLAVIVVSVVVLVTALTVRHAMPRDLDGRYANSKLKPWFDSLTSGKGPCCSDADGYVVSDPDWDTKRDAAGVAHYRVRIDGEWYDVPDDALVTVPNLYGRTMVWPIRARIGSEGNLIWDDNSLTIRCFMPGPMT